MKRILALITVIIMIMTLFPLIAWAADVDPTDGYNDNDFAKIQTFLNQPSADPGKTNGQAINPDYDPNDPSTWTDVFWNSDAEKRVIQVGNYTSWYDKGLAGALDLSGLDVLTCVYLSANEITSLNVSGCFALAYLYCESNKLTVLDVSNNLALSALSCGYNNIGMLKVGSNTALESLNCDDCGLTELDVSLNTALIHLNCASNAIGTLNVGSNTALESLNCDDCGLTELDVSLNTALIHLNCASNAIGTLNVGSNTALERLYCSDCALTSLDVSANTALVGIICSYNAIGTLDVGSNTALEQLFCSDCGLTSADVNANASLITLDCSKNSLGSLDMSLYPSLQYLYCEDSALTALDVSTLPGLIDLDCSKNSLGSLDISNNTALMYLSCQECGLTALDVSAHTALTRLYCDKNNIGSLDVSNNTALIYFSCQECGLATLDVSMLQLVGLGCDGNALTSLDVSKSTALEYLGFNNNALTSLDISKNTQLRRLECSSNGLTTLDISANTDLVWLECEGNPLMQMDANILGSTISLDTTGKGSLGVCCKQEEGIFTIEEFNTFTADDECFYAKGVNDNSVFIDWTQAGMQVGTNEQYDMAENTSYDLTANFGGTVTFHKNDGDTEADPQTVTARAGEKIGSPATAPTRGGYDFDGWYKDVDCVNAWDFNTDTVSKNTTLYAKWTEKVAAQKIGVRGAIADIDGQKLTNYTVELRSTPRIVLTDSNGAFSFSDVPVTRHTLIIKDTDGITLKTFSLSVAQGSAFAWTQDGDNVSITVQSNTALIDMELEMDSERNISIKTISHVANPSTGGGIAALWLVLGAAVITAIGLRLRRRRTV